MIYQFERAGEVIERAYPMGTAPQKLRVGRRVYRRVITAPSFVMADNVNGKPVGFMAQSLDPKHHRFHKGAFAKNEHGESKPVFTSNEQIRSFERNAAREGVQLHYGKFRERPSDCY